jgi:hypothetical protein
LEEHAASLFMVEEKTNKKPALSRQQAELLADCFLLASFFDPEVRGNMFHRNVC